MAKEDIVRRWLEIAAEDLEVAESNHSNGYWLYAAFLCHQSLEKTLKAYYQATHDDDPPYTHNHIRLLNVCGLIDELSEEQLRFIAHIEPMYIEARYPEQKAATARTLSKEVSQYFIEQTKELTQWIEKRLHESKPLTPSESTSE